MSDEYEITFRVRYSETDAMGYVHHSHYLSYFEMGRTELYRAQGGDYRAMEAAGLFFVVVKVAVHYRTPARYDDVLRLVTRVVRISAAKLQHEYEVFRDSELIARGETTLALVDREGVIQRIPESLERFRLGEA